MESYQVYINKKDIKPINNKMFVDNWGEVCMFGVGWWEGEGGWFGWGEGS